MTMTIGDIKLVTVQENLLVDNDWKAARNHERVNAANVLTINVMASPGAGKTSLLVRTIEGLKGTARVGVIEGDIAGSIDAATVLAAGATDAVQINTGGNCHLEAGMVDRALDDIDLDAVDILLLENVGNLVCPTHWELGEHLKLCLVGAAEGHDKPVKYPQMFTIADVVVLNKIDLIDYVDFDRAQFHESVRALNTTAPIFELSCRTGDGVAAWTEWVLGQRTMVSV